MSLRANKRDEVKGGSLITILLYEINGKPIIESGEYFQMVWSNIKMLRQVPFYWDN